MKLFDSLISDLDASVVKIELNFVKYELHFKQKPVITDYRIQNPANSRTDSIHPREKTFI